MCRNFLEDTEFKVHTLTAASIQIFIPLLILTIIYSLIIVELRHGAKRFLILSHARDTRIRLKRNRKTTKLLIIIVVVFYVCVLPVNVFYLFYLFDVNSLSLSVTLHVFAFLQMLQMVNSCVNPIIYSRLHTSFRRTTLNLLCSCCFQRFRKYSFESVRRSIRSSVLSSFRMKHRLSTRSSIISTTTSRQSMETTDFGKSRTFSDLLNHNKQISEHNSTLGLTHLVGSSSLGQASIGTSVTYDSADFPHKHLHSPALSRGIGAGDDDVFSSTGGTICSNQLHRKVMILSYKQTKKTLVKGKPVQVWVLTTTCTRGGMSHEHFW